MCFFSKWLLAPPSCLACEAKSTLWLFKGCCTLTGHLAKAILFFSSNKYCVFYSLSTPLLPFYLHLSMLASMFALPPVLQILSILSVYTILCMCFCRSSSFCFYFFFSISAVSLPWFCCFSTHLLSLSCIHWPPLTYYYQTLVPLHVC